MAKRKNDGFSAIDITESYINGNIHWTMTQLADLPPQYTANVVLILERSKGQAEANRFVNLLTEHMTSGDAKR